MSSIDTGTPAATAPTTAEGSAAPVIAAGTPAPNAGAPAATADAAAAPAATADAAAAPAAQAAPAENPPAPAAQPPAAPETYELTLPEGGVLDQSDIDQIAAIAKAKGWTNDQAQAALTDYAENLRVQSERFLTETTAHPEIGGERLAVAQEHARRALDRFLPTTTSEGIALREALDKSGYGNYAPLVLLFSRIGKAMAEDRGLNTASAGVPGQRRSAADVLFGDSPSIRKAA